MQLLVIWPSSAAPMNLLFKYRVPHWQNNSLLLELVRISLESDLLIFRSFTTRAEFKLEQQPATTTSKKQL
jgi:hypothetical protein